MTKYYAVYIEYDSEKVIHVSVHPTYKEALKKLIEVTKVEQAWKDDIDGYLREDGTLFDEGFRENYETAKETLEHKDAWTLEQIQHWTLGENDINTCWIWMEGDNANR